MNAASKRVVWRLQMLRLRYIKHLNTLINLLDLSSYFGMYLDVKKTYIGLRKWGG